MVSPASAPKTGFQHVVLDAGTLLTRVHWTANGPVWFGPMPGLLPSNRFDAPNGEFRTLYAGENLQGAFAETVLRRAARIIAWPAVRDRAWSEIQLVRAVRVVKLHGSGLNPANVTSDIGAGDDYTESQKKALEIFEAGYDGLAYRSRHNNDHICYALFDRVNIADLKPLAAKRFFDNRPVAQALLDEVGAVWDTSTPIPAVDALP